MKIVLIEKNMTNLKTYAKRYFSAIKNYDISDPTDLSMYPKIYDENYFVKRLAKY